MSHASIDGLPSIGNFASVSTGDLTSSGNFSQTGGGTFSTGTGANTLNGNTTIASGKTLAVTTADKLTIGGVITPQTKTISIPLTALSVTSALFIADEAYQLTGLKCAWGVASISGTLTIEKCTGTTAPGSGTDLLTGTLDLSATANTVVSGTLTGTVASLQFAVGDRLTVKLAGTLTNLVGGCVTITLKRI